MSLKDYKRLKNPSALQIFGISLFLISFGVFVSTLTLGKFQLTAETLEEQLEEEQLQLFNEENSGWQQMRGVTYRNQFAFVNDLETALDEANSMAKKRYAITEAEKQAIIDEAVDGNKINYNRETLAVALQGDASQKNEEKLAESTAWMFGREYENQDQFENDLSEKVDEINRVILEERGIHREHIKDLKYSITKASTLGVVRDKAGWFSFISFFLLSIGALLYMLPGLKQGPAGIKNNHIWFRSGLNLGWIGIAIGVFLILFYVVLYWYPEYLTNWVVMVDPISRFISGEAASQWFLYGLMYTIAILVMGIRMYIRYRNNKYQLVRNTSVMFFQLSFAFLIPEILVRLNQPYFDFKNIWPLDYDFFFQWNLDSLMASGMLGIFMMVWGILLIIVAVPLFTYFYGKRWYCSWVCGCGALAETAGDPYRQLSDKRLTAWKFERYSVHGVLVFAVLMTGLTLYTYFSGESEVLGMDTYGIQKTYGFLIGAAFAGIVGTGFYPFLGNRVWCRYGCPLAAYIGLIQRFKSRFRITTNGGQCISCGNCSTYCEMGIDVRWYAQRGQNIVRASCVGCGICSAVCPRGVLKLENGPEDKRFNDNPIIIGSKGPQLAPEVLSPASANR